MVNNQNSINIDDYDLTPEEIEILKEELKKEKINFTEKKKTKKRFTFAKLISLILVIASLTALGVSAYYGYELVKTADKTIVCDEENQKDCNNDIFSGILQTVTSNQDNIKIKGEEEGRTNILLIGTDQAGSLTDTIMIFSFFHKEGKVVTLNLPRDLYVTTNVTLDEGKTIYISEKINGIYPIVERNSNREGAGARALINFVSSEFGIPIHYWVTTNFVGVQKIVDELGGVDVEVDKAFTDCNYPNGSFGYLRPCPKFEVGTETMNGSRALIYARSRQGNADSGDFARGRRQSIVVEAILKKIKERGIASNINSINTYLNIVAEYVRTNIKPSEILAAYKKYNNLEISGNFLRVVWSDDVGIFCSGNNPARGYHLLYCGGSALGVESGSVYRKKAREQVQNILQTAQMQELNNNSIVYLGNQSNVTTEAKDYFSGLGLTATLFNNQYSKFIKPANATSIEKVNIYVPNAKTKEILEKIMTSSSNPPAFQYSITLNLPEDKVIPSNLDPLQSIIFWVESV